MYLGFPIRFDLKTENKYCITLGFPTNFMPKVWQFIEFCSFSFGFVRLYTRHICYTVDGKKIASYFWMFGDQMCIGFWHNLYIRRLPGPSIPGFPGFYQVLPLIPSGFPGFRRKNIPETYKEKWQKPTVSFTKKCYFFCCERIACFFPFFGVGSCIQPDTKLVSNCCGFTKNAFSDKIRPELLRLYNQKNACSDV